jgi:hypothetical protein
MAADSCTSVAGLSSSVHGQLAAFTVTVANASSTSSASPTGSVCFYDGSTLLETVPVGTTAGITTATYATSALTLGSHTIVAVYADPNGNFSTSQASTSIQVWSILGSSDPSALTVGEGQTATNSGTFANLYGNATTITASIGTIVQVGTTDGTWTWSLATTDGPRQSQTVTIVATDSQGTQSSVTFDLAVANLAPSASISGPSTGSANTPISLNATASDPSTADQAAGLTFAWTVLKWTGGVATTYATGSGASFSFVPDAAAVYDVRLTATDRNGGASATAVHTITVDTAPSATVCLTSYTPNSNSLLTARVTTSDIDGTPVTLTYVWKVNGTIQQTHAGVTSLTDTFDLSQPGYGDRGDTITVEVTPSDGLLSGSTVSASAIVADALVAGRYTFYNNSCFDTATAQDDTAIATDKQALLPGQLASFVNITSYNKGLNGIMIDVEGLADAAAISAGDLSFRTGSNASPVTWSSFTVVPASVTVEPGKGVGGSDRIVIIWTDYSDADPGTPAAVHDLWLEVTLKATPNTGLATPDVFYFGNLTGETGTAAVNPPGQAKVTAGDIAKILHAAGVNLADLTSVYDINRDGYVTTADAALSQNELNQRLYYFTAPAPSPELAAEGELAGTSAISLLPPEMGAVVSEAVSRWIQTGLGANQVARLTSVEVVICDLPDGCLGATQGSKVYVDATAAGHGWYVDRTPAADEEFGLASTAAELISNAAAVAERYDLLTVVFHELGHVLGLEDVSVGSHRLMSGALGLGMRRLPQAAEADAIFSHEEAWTEIGQGLKSEPWEDCRVQSGKRR